jgi:hypothetical protein
MPDRYVPVVVIRFDGRVEWLCPHGAGHPKLPDNAPSWGHYHTCCEYHCCGRDMGEPDA